MANINKITLPNGSTYNLIGSVHNVIGTQTAATGSWTGNLNLPALYDGLTINYYLPWAGSGNATLNLTLADGTTTGAKNCYYSNATRLTTHYSKGSNIVMTYYSAGSIKIDGTATTDDRWIANANYDSNSDAKVTQTVTTTSANYEVLFSATADNTTRTEGARKNSNLTFNPSTGTLNAGGTLNLYNEGTTDANVPTILYLKNKDTTTGKMYSGTYIAGYDGGEYGENLVIHPGGNIFIGSGESSAGHYALYKHDPGEVTYIDSDSVVHIQGNAQAIANRQGFQVNASGEILPDKADIATNNIGSIGNSSHKWANGYFTNINGVAVGDSPKFTDNDTKNTAGSTDTSSKIFLIGATSQAANPQTYSHDTAYVGTDGCLYSGGTKVLTAHQDISGKVSKTGDTMSGDLLFSNSETTTRQVQGKVGTNDYWRVAGGATASNAGWMEIATADDGVEPIYARQYSGVYTTIKNEVTLLDANGNTSFPGIVNTVKTRIANTVYGVSFGRTTGTPIETILKTGIKWVSGNHMPVVHITGYAYGLNSPVEFKIGFYIYSNKIGYCGVTNMGAWKPQVFLYKYERDSVEYVAVGLKGSCYYLQLQADVQDEMGKFGNIVLEDANWTWEFQTTAVIPEADGGTTCIEVPYKADILQSDKLPLAGGTMTGTINLASTGLKTNNPDGYTTDAHGNLIHSSTTASNFLNLNSNDKTKQLKYYWETGNISIPGQLISRLPINNVVMPLSAGKVTSLSTGTTEVFKDGIAISNPVTANDVGWIRVTGTGETDTVLEIATGDDAGAGEQIVVRQYNTSNNVAREAKLFDTSGNTSFPGTMTIGGNATLQYNSTTQSLDFIFA